MHDSGALFSDFSNFHKLKRRDLISRGQPILQNSWISWSPILYFIFKSFKDPNSLSFIRFQCVLHDSVVLFSDFSKFLQIKEGRGDVLISLGEPILQNGWIIWSTLLYFSFKSFKDPNSSLFIRFQSILHDWVVLFSDFGNFNNLKRVDLIAYGEPILQKG